MRVVTWNVNSLNARLARVLEWLEANEPDVALLQETKMRDDAFPVEAFAALGYESAHVGQGQWNGVAVLSRAGLADVERGLSDGEARLVGATCGGLRVYSCYVPNGRALDDPHYAYKLRWLDELRALLAARDRSAPVVVAGDFNVAPADLDVWDPTALAGMTHASAPERAALDEIVATGLVDVVRARHPAEPCFTWWDYRGGAFHRGWGMRIDLVYVDAAHAERVRAAFVDRDARKGPKPSDHAPVVVDLDL
ncbi:MAG TPA: exodeoxyribonuclease III [Acidimicrobiales bacterium]|nr:MAG: exodeoxyribonuclease III [Actinobacteria bacterium 21-73-9]HQU26917.1 exodeoxyribonuclease III [Acidimicrobiales bacterium]